MTVSSAFIDLTDEDDVMNVDGGQVTERQSHRPAGLVSSRTVMSTRMSKWRQTRHHTRSMRQ